LAPSDGISLGRAHALASFVAQEAHRAGAPIPQLIPLGGLRRYAPSIERVSLLAIVRPDTHVDALDALAGLGGRNSVLSREADRIAVATERGPVEIVLSPPEHAGSALVWHTGATGHVASLTARASTRGLEFDGATLTRAGQPVECATEDELYRHLDLPFVAPELREGVDEIKAAERGELPQLVATLNIRGDLHSHTNWSDGRDSVEQMVRAAKDLGYDYFAITDHSQRSAAARTLAPRDVEHQRAEVEAARLAVPGIHILHGIEVDIMPDGSLDFEDEVLAGFDIVLASLHDGARHTPERLLDRYLRAVDHPLVSIITHPANRTPAGRPGYDLDFDRLFEAAAHTGTALEVDGGPGHLDLDGALARRAIALGATLVIDSDAHRTDALGRQLQFGVGTARRGWVEPRHVLNTQGIGAVRAFIERKRAGFA
jgi:DNA polymerase (family 10)